MASENVNPDGTKTPVAPENKENQPNTQGGQDDWKAKFEASTEEVNKITMERNLLRNQLGEQKTAYEEKLNTAITEKETYASELSTLKENATKAEKREAAKAKQNELLGEFSDATKELVKDLGLELPDADDEDAIATFTEKIQKIEDRNEKKKEESPEPNQPTAPKKKVPVGSNNTPTSGKPPVSKEKTIEDMEADVADIKF